MMAEAYAADRIVITDAPGKKGEEVGDTTIVVKTELVLYAALYKNHRYRKQISVDWFWADTCGNSIAPRDTAIYLATGKSLTFKPAQVDTGFIFVKSSSRARWDSTGTITIRHGENLNFSPIFASATEVTQDQDSLQVFFIVKNTGILPCLIKQLKLSMFKPDSQNVTSNYQITRLDTFSVIPVGQKRRFHFQVDVNSDADTGLVFVAKRLVTNEGNYLRFDPDPTWLVQTPPELNIDLIHALIEQVFPGQQEVLVSMQVCNRGGAPVHQITAVLNFWHNSDDVSNEYEYLPVADNPAIISGNSGAEIRFRIRVKPEATLGSIVINGDVSAYDVHTGKPYADQGADIPASWVVTETSTRVGIASVGINCPNRDENGDGRVNLHQPFSVEVVVSNLGNEDVKNVAVSLFSDGNSVQPGDRQQVIESIPASQSQTVSYEIVAEAGTLPATEIFTVRVDSAFSSLSGRQVAINPAFDSLATVQIMNPASLSLHLATSYLQVPLDYVFAVTASVTNPPGCSDVDSSGKLSIRLPKFYQSAGSQSIQPFKIDQAITWWVRTPDFVFRQDSILIFISQKPYNKNNPAEIAQVNRDSVFLKIKAVATFLRVDSVAIVAPNGARDDTLSTEQEFIVAAQISSQNVADVRAQLSASPGYEILSNPDLPLNENGEVQWRLRAPALPDPFRKVLQIQARGTRDYGSASIFSPVDSSLSILTVARANLKVATEIIAPPEAVNGQIYPGLEFQVQGEVRNLGSADSYGTCSLWLDIQDPGSFTILGDSILPVHDNIAVWSVKAAGDIDSQPRIIKLKLAAIPNDENTDTTAFVAEDNRVAYLQVFAAPGTGYPELMVRKLPDVSPKVIAAGNTEIIMGIEFANLTGENGYSINLSGLQFYVEDQSGRSILPLAVISGMKIINDNILPAKVPTLSRNPIQVSLEPPITLAPSDTEKILVQVDLAQTLSGSFKLNLRDRSSLQLDSPFDIVIVDEFRNPVENLNISSDCPVVTKDNLKGSFANYPNPFGGPGRKRTHFIYYLPRDADIKLKIYTLIGELVWSASFSRYQRQGKKGLHQQDDITWDGRNSRGNKVLNGVYIARLQTDYGDWAMTKIAVIK